MPLHSRTVALVVLLGAGIPLGFSLRSTTAAAPSAPPAAQTGTPKLVLRAALARAGLGPEELAAAGLRGPDVTALIGRAEASDLVQNNLLEPADATLADARRRVEDLEKAIREGEREPGQLQALATARTDAASAEAQVASLLDRVFNAANQGVVATATDGLRRLQANKRWRTLPIQFLLAERTPAEWRELKEALTHERVCTKLGKPTNPTIMARLAQLRAAPAVAAALALSEANLAGVETAWRTATFTE
ncbi:MAG: hypothetical protein R3F49_25220 [Planctomycetota bacterium]